MTPLPPPHGSGELVFWRLDQATHGSSWNSGEGSYRAGGRWNSRGRRAVHAALDPALAILEVAVHKAFRTLDVVPHVLTSALIPDASLARIVTAVDVPNANWLRPGAVSAGQQAFGDALLGTHVFILIPSVVSIRSWSMIFDPAVADGLYRALAQEVLALDGRLHPPA